MLRIRTAGLCGFHIGPTVAVDMPGTIDLVERVRGTGKICPGGHGAGAAIPVTGHLHHTIINCIHGLITVILEFVSGEIRSDIRAIQSKIRDVPLPAGHGQYHQVFLRGGDRFLATAKHAQQDQYQENLFQRFKFNTKYLFTSLSAITDFKRFY